MTGTVSSSSAWLRGVVDLFASQGVVPGRLFAQAGLDIERLENPHMRFTKDEVSEVWRVAVALSGQPNLGLDRDLAQRFLNFQFAQRAMSFSPNLLGGLQSLARYLTLIGDSTAFTLLPDRGDCWLELTGWAEGGTPRQRIEFGMMSFSLLSQHVTCQPVRALAAEFSFPEPSDLHPYRMAFQCPIRFSQPVDRVRLGREDLALRIITPTDSMFALLERVIESQLTRLGSARTSYRTSEEIIRRLHLGLPARAEVARSLGLSDAALEQRLRAEDNSFDNLLDNARKELAARYLAQPGYPLPRVAGLLGWGGVPQLASASRRWWGVLPSEYRQRATAERVVS